jgi:hypothetical protein
MYICLNIVLNDGGSGRGLAPTRGSIVLTCDHLSHNQRTWFWIVNGARGPIYKHHMTTYGARESVSRVV